MEQLIKKIIIIVFYIFSLITLLLFVSPEELSMENLLLPAVVVSITFIMAAFPYLHNIKIKKKHYALTVISVFAISIRIIWVELVQVVPESDFYTYHTLAQNILKGNIKNSVFVSLFPHVFGFSKFLSFFYAVFKPVPDTAVYLNIALNLGILLMIYFLGKNLVSVNTGLTAAAIYAFWPSQIFFNVFVLTEPLYTFGVLFIICLYYAFLTRINNTVFIVLSLFTLGALTGLLRLIRPTAVLLLLSILIHYFFIAGKTPSLNFSPLKQLKQPPVFPGLHLSKSRNLKAFSDAVNSPVMKAADISVPLYHQPGKVSVWSGAPAHDMKINKNLLNKLKAGAVKTGYRFLLSAVLVLSCNALTGVLIGSIEKNIGIETARHTSGFYLLVGTNPEGKGKYNDKDAAVLNALINKGIPADEIQRKLSESGVERILKTDIMSQLRLQMFKNKCMWRLDSDCISFTRAHISKTSHINIEKHYMWLSGVADFYYSVFFFIALSSVFFLRKNIPSFCFVFYLYILGTVAAHMLAEVQSRYHYPVIPVFCILAAAVLTRKPARGGLPAVNTNTGGNGISTKARSGF